jgi:hypothetical protein
VKVKEQMEILEKLSAETLRMMVVNISTECDKYKTALKRARREVSDMTDALQGAHVLVNEAMATSKKWEKMYNANNRTAERCAQIADGYIGCDCLAADIRKEFDI